MQIFVSHASADREVTEQIVRWLRLVGQDLFVDYDPRDGIEPGQPWRDRLAREVRRSGSMLTLISDAWFDSVWCQAEYAAASLDRCRVIPVIVAAVQPSAWQRFAERVQQRFGELQWVNYSAGADAAHERLEKLLARRDPSALAFDLPPGARPYQGLQPYGEAEKAVYFGREGEVRQLLDWLRQRTGPLDPRRVTLVVGPSGTGKSSLLRAGLWPQLEMRRTEFIVAPPFVPESNPAFARRPLDALVAALESAGLPAPGHRGALEDAIEDERERRAAPQAMLLLAVDQAEALLTEDVQLQAAFCLALRSCVDSGRCLVVLTLRSDSVDALSGLLDAQQLGSEVWRLEPLPFVRLPDVIRGPAARLGVQVPAELVDEASRDTRTGDALPLLSLTLERLWRGRRGTDLTLEAYRSLAIEDAGARINPVEGSVRRTADDALGALQAADRQALLDAFMPALVDINDAREPVRRRARWAPLPTRAKPLLERLVEARLLSADGDADGRSVVVTHEALLRHWPLLAAHIAAHEGDLRLWQDIERAAADWEYARRSGANPVAELRHSGRRLARAKTLARRDTWRERLGPVGRDYLRACSAAVPLPDRAIVAAAILAVLLGFAAFAAMQRSSARQHSLQLADAAERANDAGLYDRALRLSVLALREDALTVPHPLAAVQAVRAASSHRLLAQLHAHAGKALRVAVSPDGRMALTVGDDGMARVWELQTGRPLLQTRHERARFGLFSPGGRQIVTVGEAKVLVHTLDAPDAPGRVLYDDDEAPVSGVAFSADGHRVALTSGSEASRRAIVLALDRPGPPLLSVASKGPGGFVALNRDGSLLALFPERNLWTVADGGGATPIAATAAQADTFPAPWTCRLHPAGVARDMAEPSPTSFRSARWVEGSDDCRQFALASGSGETVTLVRGGQPAERRLEHPGQQAVRLRFSADGRLLAGLNEDGRAWVIDVESGAPIGYLLAHDKRINDFAFVPSGRQLVTVADDGTMRWWDLSSAPSGEAVLAASEVGAAAMSSDGRQIAFSTVRDTRIAAVAAPASAPALTLPGGARELSFNQDNRRLLWADDRQASVWTIAGTVISSAPPPIRHREGPLSPPLGVSGSQAGVAWPLVARMDPTGRHVLTLQNDTHARLWDGTSGRLVAQIDLQCRPNDAAFAPDGKRALIWCARSPAAMLWDLGSSGWLVGMSPDSSLVTGAAFDGSGARIAVVHESGSIAVLDGRGERVEAWLQHSHFARAPIFSADGRSLATVSGQDVVLWNLSTAAEALRVETDPDPVERVAFTDADRVLVTGHHSGRVRLWDANSGHALSEGLLAGDGDTVMGLASTPDGTRLLVQRAEGGARLWHVPWLVARHQSTLRAELCRSLRQPWTSVLQPADLRVAPLLEGRTGEDVCTGKRIDARRSPS